MGGGGCVRMGKNEKCKRQQWHRMLKYHFSFLNINSWKSNRIYILRGYNNLFVHIFSLAAPSVLPSTFWCTKYFTSWVYINGVVCVNKNTICWCMRENVLTLLKPSTIEIGPTMEKTVSSTSSSLLPSSSSVVYLAVYFDVKGSLTLNKFQQTFTNNTYLYSSQLLRTPLILLTKEIYFRVVTKT